MKNELDRNIKDLANVLIANAENHSLGISSNFATLAGTSHNYLSLYKKFYSNGSPSSSENYLKQIKYLTNEGRK